MAKEDLFPSNYEDWKYCITVKCGIPLTKTFIEERLSIFSDQKHEETNRFIRLYGEDYTRQIISWFALAKNESENK